MILKKNIFFLKMVSNLVSFTFNAMNSKILIFFKSSSLKKLKQKVNPLK